MKRVTRSAVQAAVAALMSSVVVVCAHAASLGRLEVLSAAGQPLVAEIAVEGVEPGSFESLKAGIADTGAFRQAQLEPSPLLARLRFEVVRGLTADKATIRITSTEPIPARVLDTLIELNWSSGKVTREYALATSRSPAPVPEAPAVAVVTDSDPAPAGASPSGAAASPVQTQPAASASIASVNRAAALVVKRGESLSQIARSVAPNPAAVDATMAALFAANRSAFIDNSIHKLREGAQLRLPGEGDLAGKSSKEALKYLAEYDDRGDPYFQRALPVPKQVKPRQTPDSEVSGQIGKVQPEPPPAKKEDQLKVSRSSADDKSADAKANAQAEELLIREKALREANDRIAALEKNIADMQRLLDLKAAASSAKADAAPVADKPGTEVAPPVGAEPNKATEVAPEVLKPVDGALKPEPESAPPGKTDEATLHDDADDEDKKAKPWYTNGLLLGGLGGALAMGGGAVGFFFLKRRKAHATQTEDAAAASAGAAVDSGADLLNADLTDTPGADEDFAALGAAEPAVESPESANQDAPVAEATALDLDFASPPADDEPVSSLLPPEMEAGDPPQPAAQNADFLGELDSLSSQAEQATAALDALKAAAETAAPSGLASDDEFAALGDEPLAAEAAADEMPSEATVDRIGDTLADINLDLSPQGQALQVDEQVSAPAADKADLAVWQEMETKLDLAAAYVEIGDGDSAKDLLNEVIKKGDSSQVAKARDLMGRA